MVGARPHHMWYFKSTLKQSIGQQKLFYFVKKTIFTTSHQPAFSISLQLWQQPGIGHQIVSHLLLLRGGRPSIYPISNNFQNGILILEHLQVVKSLQQIWIILHQLLEAIPRGQHVYSLSHLGQNLIKHLLVSCQRFFSKQSGLPADSISHSIVLSRYVLDSEWVGLQQLQPSGPNVTGMLHLSQVGEGLVICAYDKISQGQIIVELGHAVDQGGHLTFGASISLLCRVTLLAPSRNQAVLTILTLGQHISHGLTAEICC